MIPCAADGEGVGAELNKEPFQAYERTLSTDDRTLVDTSATEAAGDILAIRPMDMADAKWFDIVVTFEQPTMLQSNFFILL